MTCSKSFLVNADSSKTNQISGSNIFLKKIQNKNIKETSFCGPRNRVGSIKKFQNCFIQSMASCWIFIVNFKTYFTTFSSVSIADFEQVNICRDYD